MKNLIIFSGTFECFFNCDISDCNGRTEWNKIWLDSSFCPLQLCCGRQNCMSQVKKFEIANRFAMQFYIVIVNTKMAFGLDFEIFLVPRKKKSCFRVPKIPKLSKQCKFCLHGLNLVPKTLVSSISTKFLIFCYSSLIFSILRTPKKHIFLP
jgi:hypothetical protein